LKGYPLLLATASSRQLGSQAGLYIAQPAASSQQQQKAQGAKVVPLLHLLPLRLLPSAAAGCWCLCTCRLLLAVVKSKGAKSKAKVASEMK
jgi:hypothetical protein